MSEGLGSSQKRNSKALHRDLEATAATDAEALTVLLIDEQHLTAKRRANRAVLGADGVAAEMQALGDASCRQSAAIQAAASNASSQNYLPRMGRQHHISHQPDAHQPEPNDQPLCALCGRPIPPQARSSLHHLTPKLKGGAHGGTVRLHQICHSAIHARYTESELARHLAAPAALREDPELARFVAWVRTKPDDFHAPTRRARGRTAKWK